MLHCKGIPSVLTNSASLLAEPFQVMFSVHTMLHFLLRSSISSSLAGTLSRTCWTLFLWAAFVRELGLQISRTPGLQEMLADTSPTLCLHLCLNLIGIYLIILIACDLRSYFTLRLWDRTCWDVRGRMW